MQQITKHTVLRPRRKASVERYIEKITLTIMDGKGNLSRHDLYFDQEPLTLKEMNERGFVGDLELKNKGGIMIPAEVEAGPIGEFSGDIVSKHVFRIKGCSRPLAQKYHVIRCETSVR